MQTNNIVAILALVAMSASGADMPVRARDLGIVFDGDPGEFNAITDVEGVKVGFSTIISGEGKLEAGDRVMIL